MYFYCKKSLEPYFYNFTAFYNGLTRLSEYNRVSRGYDNFNHRGTELIYLNTVCISSKTDKMTDNLLNRRGFQKSNWISSWNFANWPRKFRKFFWRNFEQTKLVKFGMGPYTLLVEHVWTNSAAANFAN